MKTGYIWAIGLGMLALVGVSSYITANNYGVTAEERIEADYTDMQNVLTQYRLQISEMVQVPDMYKDDFKEVIESALKARYGEGGSKATFQWLKEHNIDYDAALYTKIQTAISAGRNKFENSQRMLIDTKRGYKTSLRTVWRGFWLGVAGFPELDLSKYEIVTSEEVDNIFKKGKETKIQLR